VGGAAGGVTGSVTGAGTGAETGDPTHPFAIGLKPLPRGVHLRIPFENMELQHPAKHCALDEQADQSLSFDVVGGATGGTTGAGIGELTHPFVVGLKLLPRGVHLRIPLEYIELQHPAVH
jgi:hypothetical protein